MNYLNAKGYVFTDFICTLFKAVHSFLYFKVVRVWLAQFVRSLPSNHKVFSSLQKFWIFVWPSFLPKLAYFPILSG